MSTGPNTNDVAFPLARAGPDTFSGEAYTSILADSAGNPPTRVYYVRFQPRARTHWHSHTGTQILLVQSGACRLQRFGGPVETHGPGAEIRIPPGVRHWHGAGPDGPMVHVAVNLGNERTDWQEAVSEEAYGGA